MRKNQIPNEKWDETSSIDSAGGRYHTCRSEQVAHAGGCLLRIIIRLELRIHLPYVLRSAHTLTDILEVGITMVAQVRRADDLDSQARYSLELPPGPRFLACLIAKSVPFARVEAMHVP